MYSGRVSNPPSPRKRRGPFRKTPSAAEPALGIASSVPPDPTAASTPPGSNPDHAWKALGLVNEWIRHADAKAGVTLAFTGVLATMLFNLVKDFTRRWCLTDLTVIAACALLLMAAACCAWALTPRVNDRDASEVAINKLFYASISKNFKGDRQAYIDGLHTLTADPRALTTDLAQQVHANARIATIKMAWTTWAIRAAVASGATVAFLAVLIGVANSAAH